MTSEIVGEAIGLHRLRWHRRGVELGTVTGSQPSPDLAHRRLLHAEQSTGDRGRG